MCWQRWRRLTSDCCWATWTRPRRIWRSVESTSTALIPSTLRSTPVSSASLPTTTRYNGLSFFVYQETYFVIDVDQLTPFVLFSLVWMCRSRRTMPSTTRTRCCTWPVLTLMTSLLPRRPAVPTTLPSQHSSVTLSITLASS